MENTKPGKLWIVLGLILAVLAVSGAFYYFYFMFNRPTDNTSTIANSTKPTESWQEKGVAVAGQFADADVVDLGGGKWRLYYAVEPEVPGNNLEVYSAASTDGKTWTKEDGTRKTMAVFPDVIKISDNQYRMYYQNMGEIKSAVSSDGLSFTDEPGIRIDKTETGFNLDSVGAQSTTQLENGDYIMVYRGQINEPYQTTQKIPNQSTQLYFWAASKDGLSFEKKGLAIDSRNETLYGLADGAEWVNWDDGNLRVYFWSYAGVYYSVLENSATNDLQKFAQPIFTFTNNKDSQIKFPPNPPSDPTLAKIGGDWFMYYGQHTKGIYYATLTE